MTKVEIIQETATYYRENVARRGITDSGDCVYLTPKGKKCAVGRCMIPSLRKKAETEWAVGQVVGELGDGEVDNILKKKYQGHSLEFWRQLQLFHDNKNYWDNEGLTEKGERQLNYLIDTWQ